MRARTHDSRAHVRNSRTETRDSRAQTQDSREDAHESQLERFRRSSRYTSCTTQNNDKRRAEMTDFIHRTLRRLDRWTLTVFNPYYASDHRH